MQIAGLLIADEPRGIAQKNTPHGGAPWLPMSETPDMGHSQFVIHEASLRRGPPAQTFKEFLTVVVFSRRIHFLEPFEISFSAIASRSRIIGGNGGEIERYISMTL